MAAIVALAAVHPLDAHRDMIIHGLTKPDQHDALLGRKLAPTPPHLASRVLYVPSHNDKVTHLPVYDFTDEFKATVKEEPIGSSRFKTRFGLMTKPCGDGRGSSSVSYLLDVEPMQAIESLSRQEMRRSKRKSSLGGVVTKATLQRRMLHGADVEVGLTIPPHPAPGTRLEDGTTACTLFPSSMTLSIPLSTSFPVPPTISKFGCSRNPWFTFPFQSLLDEPRTLQWQMHPVEHGMLRYTLVEIPAGAQTLTTADTRKGPEEHHQIPFSAAEPENEHLIRAIYHNVGLGFSLSQPFSEGALLLQDDLEPELEALVLASLIGLLWTARSEETSSRKPASRSEASVKSAAAKKNRCASEIEPVMLSKKGGLFGKLLGKK